MSSRTPLFVAVTGLICAAVAFAPAAVSAQTQAQMPTSLTPAEALELAVESNPELRGARVETQRADLLVEREENVRTPLFSADAGFRYGQSPRLSAAGTRLIDSSSLTFGTRLSHTLPMGTQVALSAAMGRASRDSVELGELGVAYDSRLGVEATHPLLRGFGVDIVESSLRTARLSRESVDAQQMATTSALVQDVLATYWDLWLAQQTLEIQEAALELAHQNLANAEIRRDAGALANAELITLRMEVSSVEERLVSARNLVRQRSTELARVLGQSPESQFVAVVDEPPSAELPVRQEAMELQQSQSYDLFRQQTNIDSAKIQAQLADNDALPRLDAVGSFFIDGLDRGPGGALAQMGRFEGFVAFAGLRLELPINNRARQADAQRAHLAVRSAEIEYERLQGLLDARMISLLNDVEAARERMEFARETAEYARQNVDAQTARFEVGRGTTFEVVDALQRFQEAELRVVETEVSIVQQLLAIDDLTGELLGKWDVIP